MRLAVENETRAASIAWRAALLVGSITACAPLVGLVAANSLGASAWWATLAAAGLCATAGLASFAIVALNVRDPQLFISAALGGMLLRTVVCLAGAVALQQSSDVLARGQVFGQIVVFFLVGLLVETTLIATMIPRSTGVSATPNDRTSRPNPSAFPEKESD